MSAPQDNPDYRPKGNGMSDILSRAGQSAQGNYPTQTNVTHIQQYKEPELTDLEQIARWFKSLIYSDMKGFAKGVLGPDATREQVMDLADKVDEWADNLLKS